MKSFLKSVGKQSELIIWIVGLLLLAFNDPTSEPMFSLCMLKNMGFTDCWGCGLGKSISFLFRGEIEASFNAHFMGIPAFVILMLRIIELFIRSFRNSLFYSNISKKEV